MKQHRPGRDRLLSLYAVRFSAADITFPRAFPRRSISISARKLQYLGTYDSRMFSSAAQVVQVSIVHVVPVTCFQNINMPVPTRRQRQLQAPQVSHVASGSAARSLCYNSWLQLYVRITATSLHPLFSPPSFYPFPVDPPTHIHTPRASA